MTKRFSGIGLKVLMTLVLAGALSGLAATAAHASSEELIKNNSNGLCLNGYTGTAHAEVTVTPCNEDDTHMIWDQAAGSSFTFENFANGDCLNGYVGSLHAEVTLTPCNTTDSHMQWLLVG
jgi:hypothetical protein